MNAEQLPRHQGPWPGTVRGTDACRDGERNAYLHRDSDCATELPNGPAVFRRLRRLPALASRQVVCEGHRRCCVLWFSSIYLGRSVVRRRGLPVVSRLRLSIGKGEAVPGADRSEASHAATSSDGMGVGGELFISAIDSRLK